LARVHDRQLRAMEQCGGWSGGLRCAALRAVNTVANEEDSRPVRTCTPASTSAAPRRMSLAPFGPANHQHFDRRSEEDLNFPTGAVRERASLRGGRAAGRLRPIFRSLTLRLPYSGSSASAVSTLHSATAVQKASRRPGAAALRV